MSLPIEYIYKIFKNIFLHEVTTNNNCIDFSHLCQVIIICISRSSRTISWFLPPSHLATILDCSASFKVAASSSQSGPISGRPKNEIIIILPFCGARVIVAFKISGFRCKCKVESENPFMAEVRTISAHPICNAKKKNYRKHPPPNLLTIYLSKCQRRCHLLLKTDTISAECISVLFIGQSKSQTL